MARIHNTSIGEDAQRIFNTKTGNHLSNEVEDDIKPVILVEPKTDLIVSETRISTGVGNVYTTRTDKDTYLTGILVTMTSDAVADNTSLQVFGIIGNTTKVLVRLDKQTVTAGNQAIFVPFKNPLKLDRGQVVTHITTFTAGAVSLTTILYGYEVETTIRS